MQILLKKIHSSLFVALLLANGALAGAQEPPAPPAPPVPTSEPVVLPPATPALPPVAVLEGRYLRLRPSFWGTYGIEIERAEGTVGPGIFAHRMSGLVRGSPEAERHATHARTWAGFGLGFGLTGAAFLIADLAANDAHWFETSPRGTGPAPAVLALTGLVFYLLELGALASTSNEIAASVNAYNHDLMFGR